MWIRKKKTKQKRFEVAEAFFSGKKQRRRGGVSGEPSLLQDLKPVARRDGKGEVGEAPRRPAVPHPANPTPTHRKKREEEG